MNTIVPDDVLRRVHNLPSLPTAVMELLASLDQEDVRIDVLALKIEKDQALTAKTLRLANSSFYGMAHQVSTINEAITILGFRTVRSVATTAALIGTLPGNPLSSFKVTPFWRHAIATAVCAREMAGHLDIDPEYAYITGLLHDIGRLVLVTQFQPKYEATMAYRAQHDCSLLEAEQAVLGIDHAAVGHELVEHWKFPSAMVQAVSCHHASTCVDLQPLSLVVIAANAIVHALDLSMDEDDLVPHVPTGLWSQLGLNEKTLTDVLANTEKQFSGASLVLSN